MQVDQDEIKKESYNLTPKQIVVELDEYIIGQNKAKNQWQSP